MTSEDLYAELRVNPSDEYLRLAISDMLLEEGCTDEAVITSLRAGKIPMSPLDERAAKLLSGCTFLPASWNKRFAHDVAELKAMTPNQYRNLWRLVHRYRRQIGDVEITTVAAKLFAICEKPQKNVPHKDSYRLAQKVTRIAPAFEGREDLVD